MAWNEMSWAARIMPVSRPTSCSGKKPLGMYMNRPMLSTNVSQGEEHHEAGMPLGPSPG